MHALSLGILAHVDAGKTSLTERLLHAAGVIDTVGRVDDGTTRTDTLELERRRGITIRSAVASFAVAGTTVNLIDTPGHPDFVAEVERVLRVLDGAVLVVSAVEGVQARTRVLMRTLRRLGVPTLLFVNKIDRRGAADDRVLRAIAARLTPASPALAGVRDLGTPAARVVAYGPGDAAFRERLAATVAEHDDDLLAAYVDDDPALTYRRLRRALAVQVRAGLVHPVLFGSAITGAGVPELMAAVTELLPHATGDPDAAVRGTVFKVERGAGGEKIAYARMVAGTLRVRDRPGPGAGRVTALRVFEDGTDVPRDAVPPGRIARLWGLSGARVGDTLGEPGTGPGGGLFAPPTLEAVVTPRRAADRGALHAALTLLAEQDPLIGLNQDDDGGLSVSLYGEVQKEVVRDTLAADFGVDVTFRDSTTVHIERPAGTGSAVEIMHAATNPYLATVGLRAAPLPYGAGVTFALDVELGSLPYAFVRAVEESVHATLGSGGEHGWRVTDCAVTLTHSGYAARQSHAHGTFDKSMSSTAGDFRALTRLVLARALRRAGTRVYEPMHRFRLEVPAEALAAVLPVLTGLRAAPRAAAAPDGAYVVDGVVPAASVHGLEQRIPSLTSGEGVLETSFDHYRQVRGVPPERRGAGRAGGGGVTGSR